MVGLDAQTAYLVRIAIAEGHLLAAVALYDRGMVEGAIGLSYHPEAKMMEEVREGLAKHAAADSTLLIGAFSTSMESGGDAGAVKAALGKFHNLAELAMAAAGPDAKARFAVAGAMLKPSAAEYADSIEGVAARVELLASQVR